MLKFLRQFFFNYFQSNKYYPIIAALASGLYPILYYYENNFNLVNSWIQLSFFIVGFLILPAILFIVVYYLFKRALVLKIYKSYVIPILNLSFFSFFCILSSIGFNEKLMLIIVPIAFILGILFYEQIKKIIVIQFLLACLISVKLIPNFYRIIVYSDKWMIQPDNIGEVKFVKRPNVYVIQPDGYVNFSELSKGYYNFDNNIFEDFLKKNEFKLYDNFRSNYSSTLTSNSSMFTMKHHYFNNNPKKPNEEVYYSRNIIVGDNPVLEVFKNNGYKTSLLLEKPFFLINRPKLAYDFCNINYSDIGFLDHGSGKIANLTNDLNLAIKDNKLYNNFYFIRKSEPGHIARSRSTSLGKRLEREKYLKKLQHANNWLKETIDVIVNSDNNVLIVIVADHGGYVGFNNTEQRSKHLVDRELVYSIYSSVMAIKWPNDASIYDYKISTSVNLFRIIFSYLSENDEYLKHLQDDKSFSVINENSTFGVYEVIDEFGEIVFKKANYGY